MEPSLGPQPKMEELMAFFEEMPLEPQSSSLDSSYMGKIWSMWDGLKSGWREKNVSSLDLIIDKIGQMQTILSNSPEQIKYVSEDNLAKIIQSLSSWSVFHPSGAKKNKGEEEVVGDRLQEAFAKINNIREIIKNKVEEPILEEDFFYVESKEEEKIPEDLSSPEMSVVEKQEIEDMKRANRRLFKPHFKYHVERDKEVINDVKSLLVDKASDLYSTESIAFLPGQSETMNVNKKFFVDVHRLQVFAINHNPICGTQLKEDKDLKLPYRHDNNEDRKLTLHDLWTALKQDSKESDKQIEVTMQNLEALLTQGSIASPWGKLKEKCREIPISQAMSGPVDVIGLGALRIDVQITPQTIHVTISQYFQCTDLGQFNPATKKDGLPFGYIAVKREISIPREELNQPLEARDFDSEEAREERLNEVLPNLKVTDIYSDLHTDQNALYQLGLNERGLPLTLRDMVKKYWD